MNNKKEKFLKHHNLFLPVPGLINQTENPRRWSMVGESERESEYGNTTVVLAYDGHQMVNFILI